VEKNCEDFCRLEYPGARKVVVGGGPQLEYLQEKYPKVEFVGMQIGRALAKYYQSADCLVFTSRWDTFGIVMLEAMACGTPIAGYPVCGPRDVVEAYRTGCVNDDLGLAVAGALTIPREVVVDSSQHWTWQRCWEIFRDNLVER
jgi:glycosyltransferase involved in cell wall biosynthesis